MRPLLGFSRPPIYDNINAVGTPFSVTAYTATPGMAALSSSRIAFLDRNSDLLRAYDFNGSTWSAVGGSISVIANGQRVAALSATRVVVINNAADVSYLDFNGTSWSLVDTFGPISGMGPNYDIVGLTSTDYVLVDSNNQQIRRYSFNGTSTTTVGNFYNITEVAAVAAVSALTSNRIVVSRFIGPLFQVYDFDGTNWSAVGDPNITVTGFGTHTTLDSETLVRGSTTDNGITAYRFNGSSWRRVSNPSAGPTHGVIGRLAGMSSTRMAFSDPDNDDIRAFDLVAA